MKKEEMREEKRREKGLPRGQLDNSERIFICSLINQKLTPRARERTRRPFARPYLLPTQANTEATYALTTTYDVVLVRTSVLFITSNNAKIVYCDVNTKADLFLLSVARSLLYVCITYRAQLTSISSGFKF